MISLKRKSPTFKNKTISVLGLKKMCLLTPMALVYPGVVCDLVPMSLTKAETISENWEEAIWVN